METSWAYDVSSINSDPLAVFREHFLALILGWIDRGEEVTLLTKQAMVQLGYELRTT